MEKSAKEGRILRASPLEQRVTFKLAHVTDYMWRYPNGNDRRQLSFGSGDEPMWDPSGKMLYYRSRITMKAVPIEIEPSFSIGEPNDLFTEWAERNSMVRNYDFDPVNRRFIMVKPLQDESAPMQINVVLNWLDELKRLAPPPKE